MKNDKLIFRLQEIPEGSSKRTISLDGEDVSVEDSVSINSGSLIVEFFRATQFIEVKFSFDVIVKMICDRSLKPFTKNVNGSYQILFEPDPEDEYEEESSAVKRIPADDLTLDISKEVRDSIMLEIPVKKVHPDFIDDDGKIVDFETQKFGDEPSDEERIDPRWAELKKLK
ncbi:MAG TPA: DUF177 domain-containing protein [Balneolaceae bacterium]|nr:DUF177 domain-containing protein [Balneolaceae bacterium]